MGKMLPIAALLSAFAFGMTSAHAATLTVTNITGAWSSWAGGKDVSTSSAGDTSQLRWGVPHGGASKSGYDFTPAASPSVQTAHNQFALGQFTHHNFPINGGTGITSVALDVTFDFYLGTDSTNIISRTSQFIFDHWETTNASATCANGDKNGVGVNDAGCADRVVAVTNPSSTETFTVVEGATTHTYAFAVTGFDIGSAFWTSENQSNSAVLKAMFTHESYIQPAPVPLPAAAGLLIAGLGALTVAGRRRKRA